MTATSINIHGQKPLCDLSVEMLLLNQERDALIVIALELSRSIDNTLSSGWIAGPKCKIELNKKSKHATSTLEYVEALSRLDTTLRLGDAKAIIEHVNSAINAFEIADVNSWGDIATEPRRDSIKASVLKSLNQIHNKMRFIALATSSEETSVG